MAMFDWQGPHFCEVAMLQPQHCQTAAPTESTKRLCMRRRKKKAAGKGTKTEAGFLLKRRQAVRAAASSAASTEPPWMRSLAQKLWTKQHSKERAFNQDKHHKKELLGFKTGLYRPSSGKEKRKLKIDLNQHEANERKRRRQYMLSVEKRYSAKPVMHAPFVSQKAPSETWKPRRGSCQSQLSCNCSQHDVVMIYDSHAAF